MAVKKVNKDIEVVEEVIVTAPTPVEETTNAPVVEVNMEDAVAKAPTSSEREVRVRLRENHRCYIAGELYDLKKGQCYNVPKNVKFILNKAGVLSPL